MAAAATNVRNYEDVFKEAFQNEELANEVKKDFVEAIGKSNKKNYERSVSLRDEGVRHYRNGELVQALRCFNDSLTFLLGSKEKDLARNYCCRSAVYFGLGLSELCFKDLERSKSLECSINLNHQLYYNFACYYYKRRDFYTALNHAKKCSPYLKRTAVDKATSQYLEQRFKDLISEIENDRVLAPGGKNLINRRTLPNKYTEGMVRTIVEENKYDDFLEVLSPEFLEAIKQSSEKFSLLCQENNAIQQEQFTNNFEVCGNQETGGLYLKAKQDLNKGTFVTVSKPFVAILNHIDNITLRHYCSYCYQRADIMMIPCDYCSEVRFCSDRCRINAWIEFHYVECGYSKYLSEIGENGYLCLRILLKVGITKLALIPLSESTELPNINPNVTDPTEFYKFLYNLPFKNQSVSKTNEAVKDAIKILLFLDEVYSRITKLEDKSVKIEDLNPTIPLGEETLPQEERYDLGLRIVKHWLQIDLGDLKHLLNRVCSVNIGEDTATEYPAVSILPLLPLFRHSCDPNVYSLRIEGGPIILRTARDIECGDILTVAKGTDVYSDLYKQRKQKLGRDCNCEGCVAELESPQRKVELFEKTINRAEKFYSDKRYGVGLDLAVNLPWKKNLIYDRAAWFWKFHKLIIKGLKNYLKYCEQRFCIPEPVCVWRVLKAVLHSLQVYDFSPSLYPIPKYCELFHDYTRIVVTLLNLAPTVLKKKRLVNSCTEFLRLQCLLHEDIILKYSLHTPNELYLVSMSISGTKCLEGVVVPLWQ